MPVTTPGEAVPSAKRAFFAWRGIVRQRVSTDWDLADHPLVREAFGAGVKWGKKSMVHTSAEWVQLAPLMATLLEELLELKEVVEIVGDEDDE